MNWLQENMNTIILGDCLDVMKQLPDNYFDLVLTDPPYGINYGSQLKGKGVIREDGKELSDKNGWKSYNSPEWDTERPSEAIFKEIKRISKNQIIWGGNYFADLLSPSQCWLVWDKGQRNFSLADGELAWTSFDKAMRIFTYARAKQLNSEIREHPTQKPVKLIEWCIKQAEKELNESSIILDCFSGSGTTAIACHNLNYNFICIEKDYDYWKASCERLDNAKAQLNLFREAENE